MRCVILTVPIVDATRHLRRRSAIPWPVSHVRQVKHQCVHLAMETVFARKQMKRRYVAAIGVSRVRRMKRQCVRPEAIVFVRRQMSWPRVIPCVVFRAAPERQSVMVILAHAPVNKLQGVV